MFTEINKHTTVKRYGEIISFLKQHEVEIRDNEKIPVHITGSIPVYRIVKEYKVLQSALLKHKFHQPVFRSGQDIYIQSRQLSFLLKTDKYLYDTDRAPETLVPEDIQLIFMLYV